MTRFRVKKTSRGTYQYVFRLKIRFRPSVFRGNEHTTLAACIDEINDVKDTIHNENCHAYTKSRLGWQFTLFSLEKEPIGFSRTFFTQRLMKRMLAIVQQHAASAEILLPEKSTI